MTLTPREEAIAGEEKTERFHVFFPSFFPSDVTTPSLPIHSSDARSPLTPLFSFWSMDCHNWNNKCLLNIVTWSIPHVVREKRREDDGRREENYASMRIADWESFLIWDGMQNQGEYITAYPLHLKVKRRVVILTDRMNEERSKCNILSEVVPSHFRYGGKRNIHTPLC